MLLPCAILNGVSKRTDTAGHRKSHLAHKPSGLVTLSDPHILGVLESARAGLVLLPTGDEAPGSLDPLLEGIGHVH